MEGKKISDTSDSSQPSKKRKVMGLNLKLDADVLVDACVEMVTVNGRPLSALEDSGFRKILDPILRAVNRNSDGPLVTIGRKSIKNHIIKKAENVREQIRKEVAGRLVCLKVDTASRMGRHLLGVNIQFIKDGKLCLRNLAVKEIFDSHTADNLKKEIEEVLAEFGLSLSSVYTGTTDNAGNMLKMVKILDKEAKEVLSEVYEEVEEEECPHISFLDSLFDDEPTTTDGAEDQSFSSTSSISTTGTQRKYSSMRESSDEEVDDDDEISASSDTDDVQDEDSDLDDYADVMNEDSTATKPTKTSEASSSGPCPQCDILKKVFKKLGVHGVRCAAHTLQLSIEDAFKKCQKLNPTLKKARNLCKLLRIPTLAAELKKLGFNKITTEGETRWHSLYDMLISLLNASVGCEQIAEMIKSKQIKSPTIKKKFKILSDKEWDEIKNLCDTLEPARTATKKLQLEQLTVGDFYGAWLECIFKIKNMDFNFAKELFGAMKRREQTLLSTPVFAAAIYMDPRYRLLLPQNMLRSAEEHLKALWIRIRPRNTTLPDPADTQKEDEVVSEDPVEQLLQEADKAMKCSAAAKEASMDRDITKHLDKIGTWPRLPRSANILEFWEKKKNLEPELYKLACAVLAVPMTQVSVERTFSHTKQILSMLRYSMSSQLIKDILLVRCNSYYG